MQTWKRGMTVAVMSAALVLSGCTPQEPVREGQSLSLKCNDCNVLFVSFDALQASHVGALGYSRDVTPTMDAVAREGFSFTNTISVASWTVPASMTWVTGLYPCAHRMTNRLAVYEPPVRIVGK